MTPGELVNHLEASKPRGHDVDWADDLDADEARRLHAELHDPRHYRQDHAHQVTRHGR